MPYRLWRIGDKAVRLPVAVDENAQLVIVHEVEGGPTLRFAGAAQPRLGRLLDASGRPLPLPQASLAVTIGDDPGFPLVTMIVTQAPSAQHEPTPVVLQNVPLLAVSAKLVLVRGRMSGVDLTLLDDGLASMSLGVSSWVPTLPDPCVSDFSLERGFLPARNVRRIGAHLTWSNDEANPAFHGDLGGVVTPVAAGEDGAPRATERRTGTITWLGLFDEDRAVAAKDRADDRRRLGERERRLHEQRNETAELFGKKDAVPPLLRLSGPALFDVSTKSDLVELLLSRNRNAREERRAARFFGPSQGFAAEFSLSGLAAHTRLDHIELIALLQIQWEPVFTLAKDQNPDVGWFPPEPGSPHDGGPTRVSSGSPRLVPSLPEVALDAAVRAFADEAASLAVGTTLPFGVAAGLDLAPWETGDRKPDVVTLVTLSFATRPALEGGLQLSLRAQGGLGRPETESPSLAGFARQTPNGVVLATGATTGLSVLSSTAAPAGSVECFFNLNFDGPRPRAPLTRLDLSGYGASTFSDWNDPLASFGEAAKVQFTVLVGRTAYEFVKIVSTLYPWGITLTRSVTTERRGGGGVLRRDSGWQASSSSLFDFRQKAPGAAPGDPPPAPAYVIEPGLIERLFNVDRIRPALPGGGEVTLPGGKVVAMLFDADVAITGRAEVEASRGVLGFLHVEPLSEPISPEALRRLVEIHRSVGGPIDAVFDLASSGLLVRALGIEIAQAGTGPGAGLADAVRVALAFPSVGSWAVVRGPAAGDVEMSGAPKATPVIRTGVVQAPRTGASSSRAHAGRSASPTRPISTRRTRRTIKASCRRPRPIVSCFAVRRSPREAPRSRARCPRRSWTSFRRRRARASSRASPTRSSSRTRRTNCGSSQEPRRACGSFPTTPRSPRAATWCSRTSRARGRASTTRRSASPSRSPRRAGISVSTACACGLTRWR